jgi:hypothetical protein
MSLEEQEEQKKKIKERLKNYMDSKSLQYNEEVIREIREELDKPHNNDVKMTHIKLLLDIVSPNEPEIILTDISVEDFKQILDEVAPVPAVPPAARVAVKPGSKASFGKKGSFGGRNKNIKKTNKNKKIKKNKKSKKLKYKDTK